MSLWDVSGDVYDSNTMMAKFLNWQSFITDKLDFKNCFLYDHKYLFINFDHHPLIRLYIHENIDFSENIMYLCKSNT